MDAPPPIWDTRLIRTQIAASGIVTICPCIIIKVKPDDMIDHKIDRMYNLIPVRQMKKAFMKMLVFDR